MNAEFNVWLLIVGLVLGAGLVWLVVMDSRRREIEVDDVERPREALWLSTVMREDGFEISPEAAERLLLFHRAYLDAPPPDGPEDGSIDPAVAAASDAADVDAVADGPPEGQRADVAQAEPRREVDARADQRT